MLPEEEAGREDFGALAVVLVVVEPQAARPMVNASRARVRASGPWRPGEGEGP